MFKQLKEDMSILKELNEIQKLIQDIKIIIQQTM